MAAARFSPALEFVHFQGHCGGVEGAIRGMETEGGDRGFGHFLA